MTDGHGDPLHGIGGIACDLDGVVYRGRTPIDGSIEALADLVRRGIRVVYCTNNSFPTVDEYVEKLRTMGLELTPDALVTSAVVAGEELAQRGYQRRSAFVIGGDGIREALTRHGILLTSHVRDADAVVMGRDKGFDFALLDRAAEAIRNGAGFFATNDDATYPTEDRTEPGAGALVAAVATAAGRWPEVFGKPHRPMLESIRRRFAPHTRIAAVGDRPETDLAGGRSMGWKTILVLSGVTTRDQVAAVEPAPDVVVDSLANLVD